MKSYYKFKILIIKIQDLQFTRIYKREREKKKMWPLTSCKNKAC